MFDLTPFATPIPQRTSKRENRKWYAKCAEYAAQMGLPPGMNKYAVSRFRSKVRVAQFAQTFHKGCHLTGKPFTDRFDKSAPNPLAAVVRPDGTMVCYAVWLFSHEGKVPDATLRTLASAIVAHTATASYHTQHAPADTHEEPEEDIYGNVPTFPIEHPPEMAHQWPAHAAGAAGYAARPGGPDDAGFQSPGALVWDDVKQTMVRLQGQPGVFVA